MNKLLDEISQKAEGYADDTDLPWLTTYTQKLAELIVKECAVIANRAENNDTEIRCMYDVITEHFGVK